MEACCRMSRISTRMQSLSTMSMSSTTRSSLPSSIESRRRDSPRLMSTLQTSTHTLPLRRAQTLRDGCEESAERDAQPVCCTGRTASMEHDEENGLPGYLGFIGCRFWHDHHGRSGGEGATLSRFLHLAPSGSGHGYGAHGADDDRFVQVRRRRQPIRLLRYCGHRHDDQLLAIA
ncbi:hypothetical protein PMAYCL1PPCAC_17049 [Pristionchus mayeri]|uniref:Uncharacterized protein n=1 Tax=Pristionchus mayeri TaxID=1317129 RepID=A0AAN5CM35_9BILA|nr:hypothetical protein PMAYCL1PPCAC_17049 [Pristionchus mayeri]